MFQRPACARTRPDPARYCNHGANSNGCISANRLGRAVGRFLFVTDQPLTNTSEKLAHFVLRSDALCHLPRASQRSWAMNITSLSSDEART